MTEEIRDKISNYVTTQEGVVDNRDIEARALLTCASRLREAIDGEGKDMKAYGDAIRYNQRLWTMFRVALSEPDNQLPASLKSILFNLGGYVDRVSLRAVKSFAPQLLGSLIDINRIIATGLQKKVSPEAVSTTTHNVSSAPPIPPASMPAPSVQAPVPPPSGPSIMISA